jgi:hypothetical protein
MALFLGAAYPFLDSSLVPETCDAPAVRFYETKTVSVLLFTGFSRICFLGFTAR